MGEDDTIVRICTSSNLDGCLTALGTHTMANTLVHGLKVCQYAIEVLKFLVLTFDSEMFSNSQLVSSYELHDRNLVLDAFFTDEYWILCEARPVHAEFLFLADFQLDRKVVQISREKAAIYHFHDFVWQHEGPTKNQWNALCDGPIPSVLKAAVKESNKSEIDKSE